MALPATRESGRGELLRPTWSIWEPFSSIRREMERLFEDFEREFGWGMPATERRVMTPRIDVSETESELTLQADLPGVDENDVEVLLEDGRLILRGEKKEEKEEKKKDYHLHERYYGSFARSIPLPFEADPDKVKATFDKGVLTVTVPKPEEVKAKQRKIPISKS